MNKNNKAQDLADEIAKYIMVDLPIPTHLMDNLMAEVYEDVKQEREGRKPSNSP